MNRETREECLDWLYRLRSEIYLYMPKKWQIPMNNALDVAIKALEHPEQNVIAVVPCGDAISRQEVVKAVDKHTNDDGTLDDDITCILEDVPSVTPQPCEDAIKALEQEPKTGRWEEVQFRTIPYNRISKAKKCSVCGKRKDKYVTWNYCPNCGSYNGG